MDRNDLAVLVRTHQAAVYRYLRYLGADPPAAEDLAQDTFLTAYTVRTCPPLDDASGMAAWLRVVARNLFLQHCRKQRASPLVVNSDRLAEAEAVWRSAFLRGGDGFDYFEALRQCVQTLPERQRHVLDIRYRDKKSRIEMAGLLEMTQDGVKSLLRRIRALLAACVERRLADEGVR